jgi:hypothetical protein
MSTRIRSCCRVLLYEQEPLWRWLERVLQFLPSIRVWFQVIPLNIGDMPSDNHALEFLPIIIQLDIDLTESVRNVSHIYCRVSNPIQSKHRNLLILLVAVLSAHG